MVNGGHVLIGRIMFICQKVWELDGGSFQIISMQTRPGQQKGKNMVVCDELRNKMMKPLNPGTEKWKENIRLKPACRIKLNSSMLIEKYISDNNSNRRGHKGSKGG
jgi:hypothetical protein